MAKISDAEKLREYVKQPPQAVDVEKLVLGAMLLESNAVNKVIDILQPEYFYDPKHQAIFEAMVSLFKSSEPIDAVSLFKELRKANKMEAAGGAAYISQLAQDVATTTNVEYHARVVVEKWILRELIKISIEIASSAYEGSKDVFDLLDEAESKIFEISEETFKESYVSMEKAVWEAIE